MQQVGFGVFFLYPPFGYSCPTSLVKNMIFLAYLAPGKIYWEHRADTFFIALKHGADTVFAVSSHGSDTFLHYLEANEKIFAERNAVAAIFFTEIADSD